MSAGDKEKHSGMAEAIAELHAFMSPLFIWKMIWEEVLPRVSGNGEDSYRDKYKILTSTHGFANLLALWYICSELYQGIAPAKIIIQKQLALAPGVGKEPFEFDRSRQTTKEILSHMVLPNEKNKRSNRQCLGWFVEMGGKNLAEKLKQCEEEYKNSVRYIYYANEIIKENVVAIMKTAIAVCYAVRTPEFIEEQKDFMLRTGVIESETRTHEYLNETLREKFANLIIKELRKYNFVDEDKVKKINENRKANKEEVLIVNVASLREDDDKIPVFKKYVLTKSYPPTMYI